jgi:hypothetical protein
MGSGFMPSLRAAGTTEARAIGAPAYAARAAGGDAQKFINAAGALNQKPPVLPKHSHAYPPTKPL